MNLPNISNIRRGFKISFLKNIFSLLTMENVDVLFSVIDNNHYQTVKEVSLKERRLEKKSFCSK